MATLPAPCKDERPALLSKALLLSTFIGEGESHEGDGERQH